MGTDNPEITEVGLIAVQGAVFRAWNDHDIAAIVGHLSEDVVWTDPTQPEPLQYVVMWTTVGTVADPKEGPRAVGSRSRSTASPRAPSPTV